MGLVFRVRFGTGVRPRGVHEADHGHIALRPHLQATRRSQVMARHPNAVRNAPILGDKAHFPRTLGKGHGDHGAVEGAVLLHQRYPGPKAGNQVLRTHPARRFRRRHAALDVAVNIELA